MRWTRSVAAIASFVLLAGSARATVQTREITYEQGGTPLKGFLAYDDATQGKRPGVLVIHEWWGLNDHAREQAKRLAQAGYVAFAADMYGHGKVAKHPQDAEAFVVEASKDPATVTARFDAAMAVLQKQPQVDASRLGAIGYCFGGGVALKMASAGKPLSAVATFHAAIPTASVQKGAVKPAILIQTGGADPMVPVSKVDSFANELKKAGGKVEVVVYPGAKHSFTVPDAAEAGVPGLQYDADAAKKSWSRMIEFLKKFLNE